MSHGFLVLGSFASKHAHAEISHWVLVVFVLLMVVGRRVFVVVACAPVSLVVADVASLVKVGGLLLDSSDSTVLDECVVAVEADGALELCET